MACHALVQNRYPCNKGEKRESGGEACISALCFVFRMERKTTGTFLMRRFLICLILLLIALPVQAQDNTGYAEAERRIAEAKVAGASELDLSNLALDSLPDDIGKLTHLQRIYAYNT